MNLPSEFRIAGHPPNPWVARRGRRRLFSRGGARTYPIGSAGGHGRSASRRAVFSSRYTVRRLISFEAICAQEPLLHEGFRLISFEAKTRCQARCNITDTLPVVRTLGADCCCTAAPDAAETTAPQMRPIRTYAVTVPGWPPTLYSARSAGKARAACWRSYGVVDGGMTFGGFLAISTIKRVPDPPGIGTRILVCGKPATRVIGYGQYTHFMRDDSDAIMCAHPHEVDELAPPPASGTDVQENSEAPVVTK